MILALLQVLAVALSNKTVAEANLFCEESQPFIQNLFMSGNVQGEVHETGPAMLEDRVLKDANGTRLSLKVSHSINS